MIISLDYLLYNETFLPTMLAFFLSGSFNKILSISLQYFFLFLSDPFTLFFLPILLSFLINDHHDRLKIGRNIGVIFLSIIDNLLLSMPKPHIFSSSFPDIFSKTHLSFNIFTSIPLNHLNDLSNHTFLTGIVTIPIMSFF